jgi:hypothetical protein
MNEMEMEKSIKSDNKDGVGFVFGSLEEVGLQGVALSQQFVLVKAQSLKVLPTGMLALVGFVLVLIRNLQL